MLPRLSQPSVLAVTSQLPWPLDSGGHLRSYHVLRALASHFRVRLVAGIPSGTTPTLAPLHEAGITVLPVPLPRRHWTSEAARLAGALLTREPYVLYRRHDWAAMHTAVAHAVAVDAPACLYLDHLDSFLFARHRGQSRVVIDLHNVYSRLAARTATEDGVNPATRLFLRREAQRLALLEARAAQETDQVLAVSDDEAEYFSDLGGRTTVVPNGVDVARYAALPTGRRDGAPNILFVGTLNWTPNVQAVTTLATDVLPAVRRILPEATLTLVGRDPAPAVSALAGTPGLHLAGAVPEVLPWLASATLLAVPLESGGGTRLKILEAFAAGLPVVSSAVGCEGIAAQHGTHLIVAERASAAAAIVNLLQDREAGVRLATAARGLASSRYDWNIVGAAAVGAITALLPQTN